MVHEFENLPRPTVWSWIGRQFDKLELLKRDQGIQEALTPLLAAAAPQFIRDFAAYDDREMALAGACETLLRLAYATVVGAGPTREAYELHWAQDTGKNWKQATEFPDRLVAMANEIEHRKAKGEIEGMNASLLLGSPRYADLAAEMRRYARFLVRRIEKVHARRAGTPSRFFI